MTSYLVLGCTFPSNSNKDHLLHGVWILRQVDYPTGLTETLTESEGTLLRLYDKDSAMYQCWLTRTKTGLIVKSNLHLHITLIDKGHSEYLYLEDDNPRPLAIADDSTIIIQQNGALYTWNCADDIANEWSTEIKEIMTVDENNTGEQRSYMLSSKERQQANVINAFIFSTIGILILLLLIARIAIDYRKDRRRLQLQLQQIQEIQEERPQIVRQAIESVEVAYFTSDEYQAMHHHISSGQRLKDDNWFNIESQLKKVYPGFCSQLRNLYAMSDLEYQVCLLIKFKIAPTDIAKVLSRDVSTISTVRSRLYKKVFNRKGGAKEWDEFILSIGA